MTWWPGVTSLLEMWQLSQISSSHPVAASSASKNSATCRNGFVSFETCETGSLAMHQFKPSGVNKSTTSSYINPKRLSVSSSSLRPSNVLRFFFTDSVTQTLADPGSCRACCPRLFPRLRGQLVASLLRGVSTWGDIRKIPRPELCWFCNVGIWMLGYEWVYPL